jgi:hypothetical protein
MHLEHIATAPYCQVPIGVSGDCPTCA